MREVFDSFIPKVLGVYAITLYPFVFYRDEEPKNTIVRHELVHYLQVKKYGWFRFYGSYLWEYFKGLIKHRNHYDAYRLISWEQEAFAKEYRWNTIEDINRTTSINSQS